MQITYIILALIGFISFMAIQNTSLKQKLLLNPYRVINEKRYELTLTHVFIHADYTHLFFNLFVLYSFGQTVESIFQQYFTQLGNISYILFFLLAGITSALPATMKHRNNKYYNALGASGAVSAILFFYIVFFPQNNLYIMGVIKLKAYLFGLIYIGFEIYNSKYGKTNIGHDAHIGGAVFGVIIALLMKYYL